MLQQPELLAPAGSLETLKYAVLYGADAVYCALPEFGMRAAPVNLTVGELHEGCIFAHARGKKVYLTLNTLPTNEELKKLPQYIQDAAEAGVDAFIIADLGVLALAKKYACGVEAELGALASREGGGANAAGPVYTDPDEAVAFCNETGIDALAPSFGTAHGIYKAKPVLDLERVKLISQKTGLPLVMHGGSGVSPDDYRTGIANGLRKINYYSYMSKAGTQAVKELLAREDVTFFHDLALAAEQAMQADAEQAMRVFAGL